MEENTSEQLKPTSTSATKKFLGGFREKVSRNALTIVGGASLLSMGINSFMAGSFLKAGDLPFAAGSGIVAGLSLGVANHILKKGPN